MPTTAANDPIHDTEPTLRDLAYQAASAAKLNSFAGAFVPDPDKVNRIATTFSKTYPDMTRIANICDSSLVNQVAFLLDIPGANPTLAVLSCPFPTAIGTEAVFAGTLGDSMDIICPVTIRMRDIKGYCITVAASNTSPTLLNMAVSTSDPITEEGPDPDDGTVADPPGPDRIGLDITNPDATPCFAAFPKVFLLAGGHRIPTGVPVTVTTTESVRNINNVTNLDEFHMWYEGMRYGTVHLQNFSIHSKDTLFVYDQLDKVQFIPETNFVSKFTVKPTFLTPNDPVYHEVTTAVLAAKEKAFISFGSTTARQTAFTTPPKYLRQAEAINESPNMVTTLLQGLTTAITDNSTKTMTSTEREHAKEAQEHQHFYEILFASTIEITNDDGTKTKHFKKATVDPMFVQVLKTNKNSKATRLMQVAIESMAAEMNFRENRFASASSLEAEMFDQPLTAAIRTAQWEHQHTVIHPEGIKTHFGFHHLAPPRTWSADYKTRLEGAIKVVQQEQVEEATSRTSAKATELYHLGRTNTLGEINNNIGNFYTMMYTMITVDEDNPPDMWKEVIMFDRIMRSQEGRKWFELHRNIKELHFNVLQDIQSTIAGFVAVARRPGYKNALMDGLPVSPEIFTNAKTQGERLRHNLQTTILTMAAGQYKETPFTFKLFQPLGESPNKRKATQETTGSDQPNTRNRSNANNPSDATAAANNRIPRHNNAASNQQRNQSDLINNTTPPQGNKILKQLATDSTARLLHPGPIFPHPIKPNSFTVLCCRSAYENKACTFHNCKFYHFPANLTSVSAEIKAKLVTWVAAQPNVEWTNIGSAWATPQGNSNSTPA
jgi:hypothetical protein